MAKGKSKIETEKRTVAAMIALYCRGKGHGVYSDVSASKTLSSKRTTSSSSPFLCPECSELLHYAHQRLDVLLKYGGLLITASNAAAASMSFMSLQMNPMSASSPFMIAV